MRQRAPPQTPMSAARRRGRGETAASWEITTEAPHGRSPSPVATRGYQNGGATVERLSPKRSWLLEQHRTARLDDYHTVYRTPHHVPDRHYGAFVERRSRKRPRPVIDPDCCAGTCVGFSLIGVVFLVMVGILLDRQPIFIKGGLPQQVIQNSNGRIRNIYLIPAERLSTASAAYGAAFFYLVTAVACYGWLHRDELRARWRATDGRYEDIPDADSTIPTFHTTVGEVNDTEDFSRRSSLATIRAYQMGLWARGTAWLRHQFVLRGWVGSGRSQRRRKGNKQNPKTV